MKKLKLHHLDMRFLVFRNRRSIYAVGDVGRPAGKNDFVSDYEFPNPSAEVLFRIDDKRIVRIPKARWKNILNKSGRTQKKG